MHLKFIKTGLLIAMIAVVLLSCGKYQYHEEPVPPGEVSTMNQLISEGSQNSEPWSVSPVEIATHFFPAVAGRKGESHTYDVTKEDISSVACVVEVAEEGAIDDEVSATRRTLHFTKREEGWTISRMKYETKRRL